MLTGGACALCAARILPTDLQPLVGSDYEPIDADERGMWQSIERIEETIGISPQLLAAPQLQAYTRVVTERLVGRPVPELRIYLMRDASFNAAMFPSGMMIVHTGLLARVRDEAQFAAVLGHEAGHYFRKHSIESYRSLRRKAAATAIIGVAAGAAGSWGWIQAASGINAALVLSVFQFSRAFEAEADAYGIGLMARAGYATGAAAQMWKQLIDERRASAAQRNKRYRDRSSSAFSTHPPSEERMTDLAQTAEHLSSRAAPGSDGRASWNEVIAPHRATLLAEQVKLNDPGASLYLVSNLAQEGWTGLLRYSEGEIYRLRAQPGDDARAGEAYAAATALPDAPAEAWRAHGYALIKSGKGAAGRDALTRYLAQKPDANDAAMVRFTLTQ